LHQAIQYEVKRQITSINQGHPINQETRNFDTVSGTTKTMRTKETANDYCYFPDPDLHPVVISQEHIQHLKETLPETPAAKRQRLILDYKLSEYDADILTAEQEVTEYFQSTVDHLNDPAFIKHAANWIMGELFALHKKANEAFEATKVPASHLAELIKAVGNKTVSALAAKDVLGHMFLHGQSAKEAIDHLGVALNHDDTAIHEWINTVLCKEADKVTEYLNGKDKLLGYFVGQVMKEAKGKGDPQILGQKIKEVLNAQGKELGSQN
jgi:aspartyl-tRNA(Asn)/glutamyl-tRNA(Gln) amidotransferase subunit B